MSALLRHAQRILCAVVFVTIWTGGAFADRRVALVIGNAKYQHADTLANTINDAKAITAVLKRAGFDVVEERLDVGVVDFKRAIREFLSASANADIAVVYYSGHGMEVGGTNYLIPVDAKLASAYDVDDETVPLDRLILATQSAKRLSLIILDACRENPFLRAEGQLPTTRSLGSRLVSVEPTSADTLIAYAAKAGSLSYDGPGPNSPFTTALVKYIAEPGVDIRIALGKVRDDVLASTGNRQEPFVYGSLGGGEVSLVPAPAALKIQSAPAAVETNGAAADYEMAERVGSADAWRAFLSVHGSGYYAELARAQLAKLSQPNSAPPPRIETAEKAPPPRPAEAATQDKPQRAPSGSPSQKPDQTASLEPGAAPAPDALSKDQICARDEARLAKLRSDPSEEQVRRFAKDLGCESLRPQLKRLMESLGLAPIADLPPQAAPPTPSPQTPPDTKTEACVQDAARLARLRADPSTNEAAQFWRELGCEDLRPQVKRLIESLGVSANAPSPPPTPANAQGPTTPKAAGSTGEPKPAPITIEAPKPAEAADPCKRDAEELARIRANPDRASAQRFARELKCEALKAQAARLLESVGD